MKKLIFFSFLFSLNFPLGLFAVEIDSSLKKDTPTIQEGNKVFISNADARAAAKYAASSPNADPLVGVPPGPTAMREEWKKNFQKEYAAAGGKGAPAFTAMKRTDVPEDYGPGWGKGGVKIDPELRKDTPTKSWGGGGVKIDPELKRDTPTMDPDSPDAHTPTKTQNIPPVDPHAPTKIQTIPGADSHTRGPAQTHVSGSEGSENFGKAMGALGAGMDGLDKAGQVAAGIQKEREKAAADGVDASARNAAENVVGTAIGADSYNTGKKNAQDAIARADKEGRSRGSAALEALWKTAKDMSGITAAQEIFKEESEKEKKQAAKESREESGAGVVGTTAVRVAGDKIGLNPILDASMYDAEADRQAGDAGRRTQEKLKTELEEHLKTTGQLEQRMKRLKEREDMTNPSNRQWVRDLQNQYLQARQQAQDINNRTRGKMLNEADPQLIAIRQAVDLLPENPAGVDMNDKELTLDEQVAAHDCSKYPNTKAGWNEAMGVPGCFCVEGFKFNKGETECVPDISAQIDRKDCSGVAGSVPMWNESSQSAYCGCIQGNQMNAAQTACEPSDEVLQRQAQPITCPYPNTEQAWFRAERMFKCVCKPGFDWDKTGYACVEPGLAGVDCRHIKGATPVWYNGEGVCGCAAGHVIENNVCVPSRETRVAQTNCSHIQGASPYWDDNLNEPMCTCQPGYVIVNNACVPEQQPQPPPVQQPPAFDPSGLIQQWNEGTGNSGGGAAYNPHLANGNWWGNNSSGGTPVPSQLPGLGASTGQNSMGGSHAGFTGFGNQPAAPVYNPPPTHIPKRTEGGVDTSAPRYGNSPGVNTDAGDPCVTTHGRIC